MHWSDFHPMRPCEVTAHDLLDVACEPWKSSREPSMPATAHPSYWHETAESAATHYPPLAGNIGVDVAILGGGITGLTAAAHLRQGGRSVAVLEAAQIG